MFSRNAPTKRRIRHSKFNGYGGWLMVAFDDLINPERATLHAHIDSAVIKIDCGSPNVPLCRCQLTTINVDCSVSFSTSGTGTTAAKADEILEPSTITIHTGRKCINAPLRRWTKNISVGASRQIPFATIAGRRTPDPPLLPPLNYSDWGATALGRGITSIC